MPGSSRCSRSIIVGDCSKPVASVCSALQKRVTASAALPAGAPSTSTALPWRPVRVVEVARDVRLDDRRALLGGLDGLEELVGGVEVGGLRRRAGAVQRELQAHGAALGVGELGLVSASYASAESSLSGIARSLTASAGRGSPRAGLRSSRSRSCSVPACQASVAASIALPYSRRALAR